MSLSAARLPLAVGALTLCALLGVVVSVNAGVSAGTASDRDQIVAVLRESIRARGMAARTFDTSSFATIFIDDPNTPLNATQNEFIARFAPQSASGGLLTYYEGYFAHWQAGVSALHRVQAARAAGQAPAPGDLRAMAAPRTDPLVIPAIIIKSLTITGDRAYFEADTEPAYYRLSLIRVAGRWLIAGETATVRG